MSRQAAVHWRKTVTSSLIRRSTKFAHSFLLGDDTAYRLGRVTLNPLKHIDPFSGAILMPRDPFASPFAISFRIRQTGARPNFDALRHPRHDMVLVAVAGPATNMVLATLAAALPISFILVARMGRAESEELSRHQRRVGRLQHAAAAAA